LYVLPQAELMKNINYKVLFLMIAFLL